MQQIRTTEDWPDRQTRRRSASLGGETDSGNQASRQTRCSNRYAPKWALRQTLQTELTSEFQKQIWAHPFRRLTWQTDTQKKCLIKGRNTDSGWRGERIELTEDTDYKENSQGFLIQGQSRPMRPAPTPLRPRHGLRLVTSQGSGGGCPWNFAFKLIIWIITEENKVLDKICFSIKCWEQREELYPQWLEIEGYVSKFLGSGAATDLFILSRMWKYSFVSTTRILFDIQI